MSRLETLGKNLKKYREKKGWSQAKLAEKIGFSTENVCRIENGKRYISLKKLFELTEILDVDIIELFKTN